jgi:hypothetical protein
MSQRRPKQDESQSFDMWILDWEILMEAHSAEDEVRKQGLLQSQLLGTAINNLDKSVV